METNINSGQIEIVGPHGSVFLYTHNLAHNLVHVVRNVLEKKMRWNDPDYLARMLFCEMVPEELWYSDKGFGIGTEMYVDVKYIISIKTQIFTITLQERSEDDGIFRGTNYTFEDFLENFADNAIL
jgi:hypothetical protein